MQNRMLVSKELEQERAALEYRTRDYRAIEGQARNIEKQKIYYHPFSLSKFDCSHQNSFALHATKN